MSITKEITFWCDCTCGCSKWEQHGGHAKDIAKLLRKRGWLIKSNKKALCPTCKEGHSS